MEKTQRILFEWTTKSYSKELGEIELEKDETTNLKKSIKRKKAKEVEKCMSELKKLKTWVQGLKPQL